MRIQEYIYGNKQRLERVLIAVHLMRHMNETNYSLDFMHKWHHHIKSQTDSDYLAYVDFDDNWISQLDNATQVQNDLDTLTLTDTKPDKFVVELDEDGNPVNTSKKPLKNTSDDQYLIPESEDESNIVIKRNIYGEPFKDADGNFILESTPIVASDYDPLPDSGWIEENKLYKYGDRVVRCRQGHDRTIYAPEDTPALFTFVPVDSEGIPDWQVGVEYSINDHVMYNSTEYVCIQAHTSQSGWEPPNVPALWEVV